MMRFIETNKGYINLAFVRKITHWKRGSDGAYFSRLDAPDGKTLGETLHNQQLSTWDLEARDAPIVPAPPGYSLVRVFLSDGEPPAVWEELIIAFKLRNGGLEPYTLNGLNERVGLHNSAIKGPDGKVTAPSMQTWDNLDEFIADCVKEKARSLKEA
jgi:hypothetical protein